MLPSLIYEDDHLLVVNKPAGLNTHAPAPYAGEGLYDWLRHREPRWASLAIMHRLDKETSGVLVFAKTSPANRSLTQQFTARQVAKGYLLLTDQPVPSPEFTVRSTLVRAGERYVSRPGWGEPAETRFSLVTPSEIAAPGGRLGGVLEGWPAGVPEGSRLVLAEPLTGRTHQIRVQAAERGIPILGDTLYGGTAASRVYLHAARLTLRHPATGQILTFRAAADFSACPRLALRAAVIDPAESDSFRLVHGASDGWPGWYVDRLGDHLLSQSERPLSSEQRAALERWRQSLSLRGAYHKLLNRRVRSAAVAESSPHLVLGEAAPDRFFVRENGLEFELSFSEGYSVGLFLDQRDNRRRVLRSHIAAGFELSCGGEDAENERAVSSPAVLNTFAYTCGFSVCAARAGARVTSLDLSKKYLEWGRRNFLLNQLDPAQHEFIYGDVFEWLRRLAKKGRRFEAILLDPPTFSQSKASGVFRAEKDYGRLVAAAVPLLSPGGILLASANTAEWAPEAFLAAVEQPLAQAGRSVRQRHFVPQPPDFPITRAEPGYLKTVWLRVS